ncbi:MAG: autorepressor SdpR family transcription factor [Ruminococcus sp.]|nr:autorepressor SdpR family transcription factor [Ruminococcus sp.]
MALADTFKALSDAQRRDILGMLRAGRMSAGEIAGKLEITPAALSYHLKLLKKADLIMEYKEKNFVFYEVNTSIFDEMIMWMKQFGGNDNET